MEEFKSKEAQEFAEALKRAAKTVSEATCVDMKRAIENLQKNIREAQCEGRAK